MSQELSQVLAELWIPSASAGLKQADSRLASASQIYPELARRKAGMGDAVLLPHPLILWTRPCRTQLNRFQIMPNPGVNARSELQASSQAVFPSTNTLRVIFQSGQAHRSLMEHCQRLKASKSIRSSPRQRVAGHADKPRIRGAETRESYGEWLGVRRSDCGCARRTDRPKTPRRRQISAQWLAAEGFCLIVHFGGTAHAHRPGVYLFETGTAE